MNESIPNNAIQAHIPDSKDFFTEINSEGHFQTVDAVTGKIIAVENQYTDNVRFGRMDKYITIKDENGDEVLVAKGMDISIIKQSAYKYKFTQAIGDIICQLVSEGLTLTKICKRPAYPSYSTVTRWRSQNEDFRDALMIARAARAEVQHDKVMDVIDDLDGMTKDDLIAAKLKVDALKWSAGVNDPKTFGSRKDDNSAGAGAMTIVVNTGIDRHSDIAYDPLVIEVTATQDE